MLDFYCNLYFEKFKIMPVRIEKTDRFCVGSVEKTVKEIKREIWPHLYPSMSEDTKIKLRENSKANKKFKKRVNELIR